MLLEVIVQSVEDARAAQAGGADRLEVVRDLQREGFTPSLDLVRALTTETSLPLRVMVRESEGFEVHSAEELRALQRAIGDLADVGVQGVVLGFARDGALDRDTMTSVLSVAPGLPVTLHRAFEAAADPLQAIDTALSFPQIDRILTSAGPGDWQERCARVGAWSAHAGPRLTFLVGGGIDEAALRLLATCSAVREVHVGRAARHGGDPSGPVDAARVGRLKSLLSDAAGG